MTRILVADDDPASVDLVSSFLESRGYEVATAPDGNRAVELGSTGDFELAILDVHMPMYEGVEVLQILRRRHVLHPMRIIALTGDATPRVKKALEEGGVDAYLLKPVELGELLEKVQELVGPPD